MREEREIIILLFILGLFVTTGWNLFILPAVYWKKRLSENLGNKTTEEDESITHGILWYPLFGVAYFIPRLVLPFPGIQAKLTKRFSYGTQSLSAIVGILLICFFALLAVYVPIEACVPVGGFGIITLVGVALISIFTLMVSTAVEKNVAQLESYHPTAIVFGKIISGTLFSVALSTCIVVCNYDQKKYAAAYFTISIFFSIIGLGCHIRLHEIIGFPAGKIIERSVALEINDDDVFFPDGYDSRTFWYWMYSTLWPYTLMLWVTNLVTYAIFPGVGVQIAPLSKSYNNDIYITILCIVLFNTCDFVGGCLAMLDPFPDSSEHLPMALAVCVALRLNFLIAFPLIEMRDSANTDEHKENTINFIVMMATLAISHGYFNAIVVKKAHRICKACSDRLRSQTESSLTLTTSLGGFCGFLLSYLLIFNL